MAVSCCSPSELTFLRPNTAANRLRSSVSRRKLNRSSTTVRIRREEVIVVEKEDGDGSYSYVNGVDNWKNLNGSVIKYVNGMKVGEDVVEKKKKKTIEEIGQEEAWFKRRGRGKVEVSVAPGGIGSKLIQPFKGLVKYGVLF